jgi:hypothetical protein
MTERRRQNASWIADEWGGSYLNNPQQQNADYASARQMAALIRQTVDARGGNGARAGELLQETLEELRGRAPWGFVTPAFALGTTQVLLDRANRMTGPEFVNYLEGIKDRDIPIFFWQRTTLDPLLEEVKDRTRAHVEQVYGRSDFSVFSGMKGQRGDLAYAAGAADAVLNEFGESGRGTLLALANPIEAGRSAVDIARNLHRVPEAIRAQAQEAQALIRASQLDDYHKGYLDARILLIATDVADVVEAGQALANVSRRFRNNSIRGVDDALQAIDEGPEAMRRSNPGANTGSTDGSPGSRPGTGALLPRSRSEVVDGAVAAFTPDRQPAYRQALGEALDARGISDADGARRFVQNLNGAPDGPTMQGIHRRASALITGADPAQAVREAMTATVRSAPDNVEWAYDRALRQTFRERGIDTPDEVQRYLGDLARQPNGAAMQALNQRAYANVLDNAVERLPMNTQDLYRRAVDGLARENGHTTIEGVQRYVGNLTAAPDGQSARALHNRARDLLMEDTFSALPANVRGHYRDALEGTLAERGVRDLSGTRTYIDRLAGAPNGPSMQALHRRAMDDVVGDALRDIPANARPAYRQAFGEVFAERGIGNAAEARTYIDRLNGAPDGQSMRALHQRAFDNVVDNALNALPEAQKPAYRQALGEQFQRSGVDTVVEAQRYVVNLSNSEQSLRALHTRAAEISGVPNRNDPPLAPPPPRSEPPTASDGNNGTTPPRNPPPPGRTPSPGDEPTGPGNDGTPGGARRTTPLDAAYALDRSVRMREPAPVTLPGADGRPRSYEILGMTDDGQLRLQPAGERVRHLPEAAMYTPGRQSGTADGRIVQVDGESWRFDGLVTKGWTPSAERSGVNLVHPTDPQRTLFVPAEEANRITVRLGGQAGDGPAQRIDANQQPVDAMGREYRFDVQQVDGQTLTAARHGVIRLVPAQPEAERLFRPEPGFRFEARSASDPLEGPKTWTVQADGSLQVEGVSRQGTTVSARAAPRDVAPTVATVRSPDFGRDYQVDSFAKAEQDARGLSRPTTNAPGPLNDPALGVSPEAARARLLQGADSLQAQADFITRAAREAPPGSTPRLTVFNIGFNNGEEAGRVLGAMREFRRMHPNGEMNVVMFGPSMNTFADRPDFPDLQRAIDDLRINRIDYSNRTQSVAQVIHAKGAVVDYGDAAVPRAMLTTAAVIPATAHKTDLAIELQPGQARAFSRYVDGAMLGRADDDFRIQSTAENARNGVLINDPQARLPYITRGYDAVIRGAREELFVSVSEIRNPETARLIASRATDGVRVQVQYREIDAESLAILQRAQEANPGRMSIENVRQWDPKPHGNVMIADGGRVGVFATAYPWPNQQTNYGHARSLETGVVFQGESAREILREYEALRQRQAPGPQSTRPDDAQRTAALPPNEAVTPLPPRVEALVSQGVEAIRRLGDSTLPTDADGQRRLALALAGEAIRNGQERIDAVALSQSTAQRPGGAVLFGIEQGRVPEAQRYSGVDIAETLRRAPTELREAVAQMVATVPSASASIDIEQRERERSLSARSVA